MKLYVLWMIMISSASTAYAKRKGAPRSEKLLSNNLRITTILSDPYVMVKLHHNKSINELQQYEGFSIDLVNEIASLANFSYTLSIVEDRKYGNKDPVTNQWNGMIGELVNDDADVAIGDLTVTSTRSEAVDFTNPWMNFGIGILYHKPSATAHRSLFMFLPVFSLDTWLILISSYVLISIMLFIIARVSGERTATEGSQITLGQCMWFTISSVLVRNRHVPLRKFSTRIVVVVWQLYIFIVACKYIAALRPLLNVQPQSSLIQSAEDLASQTKIAYGCVRGGSTCSFFKNSRIPTYNRMYQHIKEFESSAVVNSTSQGILKVEEDNGLYAFLMESSTIEYIVERNCQLMQAGGLLNSLHFAIALQKGSEWRNQFNGALMQLREDGILQSLRIKWWKERRGGGKCVQGKTEQPLNVTPGAHYVAGVVILLCLGVLFATVTAFIEKLCQRKRSQNFTYQERSDIHQNEV